MVKDIDSLRAENARLKEQYQVLASKERFLSVINDFATSLIEQNTLEEVVWDLARNAIAKLGFEDCIIYLLDEEQNTLTQRASLGQKNPTDFDIADALCLKLGEGIVGSVAVSGVAEIIPDTTKDQRYLADDAVRYSEITVPIIAEGKVIGVIDSEHPEKNFYTKEHLEVLTTIASIAATKILQANAQEKLKKQQDQLEELVRIRTQEIEEVVSTLRRRNTEKEVLLKEIHHRVKNNMQVINSLLRLQSAQLDDSKIASLFMEAQNRVFSMALIHEQLYQSQDFTLIPVRDYLEGLIGNLKYSYGLNRNIEVEFINTVDTMDIDRLIPIGLIVNEAVTNSFQHAFPEERTGQIKVLIEPVEHEDQLRLSLSDDGIGMPVIANLGNSKSLGLELIKTLVEQIDGSLDISIDRGTTFTVLFSSNAIAKPDV